jgi:MFS transporter, FSR family, fosmidomycin resistance protein
MSSSSRALPQPAAVHWLGVSPGMLTLILLSTAHFFVDLYSGALGVLQPLLVDKLSLSLTQAGLLGGMLVVSSSVTQPLYGYLSDRWRSRMFSALAPAIAGIFISAIGYAPSFAWALLLVFIGGAGVSAFHPQGSAWATAGLERHRARWMAVFISAGTLGLALAPFIYSQLVAVRGLEFAVWAAVPGVAMTLLLLTVMPVPAQPLGAGSAGFDWAPLQAVRRPLTILFAGVFLRSAVQVTFTQFLALYLHRERGFPLSQAALILTLYLAAGAVGGFIGGNLSERFGARRVILVSFLFSSPFMAVFFFVDQGAWGIAALAFGGLVLLFTIPVNVVVAQELAPRQAGTVSALMMGFGWGTAGMVFIPLTGWVADQTSLHTALSLLLVFPPLGYWISRYLPREMAR